MARQQVQLASLTPLVRELPAAHAAISGQQAAVVENVMRPREAHDGLEGRLNDELEEFQASIHALERGLELTDERLNQANTSILESRLNGAAELEAQVAAVTARIDELSAIIGDVQFQADAAASKSEPVLGTAYFSRHRIQEPFEQRRCKSEDDNTPKFESEGAFTFRSTHRLGRGVSHEMSESYHRRADASKCDGGACSPGLRRIVPL